MLRLTVALLLIVFLHSSLAESMYKCVVEGKITYTSAPEWPSACQRIDLQVIQPSPQEVARAIKENRKSEALEAEREKQRENEQKKQAAEQRALIMKLNRMHPYYSGQVRRRSNRPYSYFHR